MNSEVMPDIIVNLVLVITIVSSIFAMWFSIFFYNCVFDKVFKDNYKWCFIENPNFNYFCSSVDRNNAILFKKRCRWIIKEGEQIKWMNC